MSIDITGFDELAKAAVRFFWKTRSNAVLKQMSSNKTDTGQRSAVTTGKNMDGFKELVRALVRRHGTNDTEIHTKKRVTTLPGFFRPTKEWDILVIHKGFLIAAIEVKSQVGTLFGNNVNNRVEKAVEKAVEN